MAKAIITEELAKTIKSVRISNNIQSKDLAAFLNKSNAYVSKLENFEIKTIEIKTLFDIFSYLYGSDDDTLYEDLYKNLKVKLTKKEIEEELWFMNFDTVYRQIPIPFALIDALNDMIKQNNIATDYLVSRINANEGLTEKDINDSNIPYNLWYHSREKEDDTSKSIKISIDKELVSNILQYETTKSAYVFVLAIVFYLKKIIKHGEKIHIDDTENKNLMDETTDFLNDYKFFSIVEKNKILENIEEEQLKDEILSSFDRENIATINSILENFKIASDIDIQTANERLVKFNNNLAKNRWFMLKIISLDFYKLEKIDVDSKKAFLEEMSDLIKRYSKKKNKEKIELF